jgi:hypothetical protein
MRNEPNFKLERYRLDEAGSREFNGTNYGTFLIPQKGGPALMVKVSGGEEEHEHGWEHVSVSARCEPAGLANRCPAWEEMCLVKRLVWREDETAIQFHPREDAYVNDHAFTLHLWARRGQPCELPPPMLVGFGMPPDPRDRPAELEPTPHLWLSADELTALLKVTEVPGPTPGDDAHYRTLLGVRRKVSAALLGGPFGPRETSDAQD